MLPERSVALFVTCLVDQIMPEIGIAAVALLERAGCTVDFPAGQTCCGQPFFNSGLKEEAARLAKRTIEVLEPYDRVVLPSGSCSAMIRVEYPHLFAGDPHWQARAGRLAEKTFELSEFLAQRGLPAGEAQGARAVTYHDSCHMCRMLGLREPPRAALRSAGAEIAEMAEPDRCCGFGGLFSLRMPEISGAMTAEKLRLAEAAGAGLLVTADPGCLMQLRRIATGAELRIEHLAIVLEEWTR